jgi:pyridoxamine 5'-phosphate oxidase
LVFYTNYRSRKAQEIAENPYVGVNFHWDILGRQLRIEGIAVRSPDAESDGYFASRDWGSQLGALGSDQSKTIASRAALIEQIQARAQILGLPPPHTSEAPLVTGPPPVERPQHWGGFRVWAAAIELWLAGPDRIHDRAEWRRDIVASADAQFTAGPWTGTRLQP